MRVPETTTIMATSAWVDFVIDPQLFASDNRPRDRRALFLLTLIGSSFASAFTYKGLGSSNTLIFSAAGKLLVTIGFLFNRVEKDQDDVDLNIYTNRTQCHVAVKFTRHRLDSIASINRQPKSSLPLVLLHDLLFIRT